MSNAFNSGSIEFQNPYPSILSATDFGTDLYPSINNAISSGSGGSITITNAGFGTSLLDRDITPNFTTKGLNVVGTALYISNTSTDITLSSTALPVSCEVICVRVLMIY